MIDKGERVMHHITTHYIPAKRRLIDAETRLRRLSHVVAASTRVVRGCKLPPPLTKRNTPNCFITALGSDRSGLCPQHATCAPLGLMAAERGFARAYGSTLEARRLWGFIASVLIQPRHPAVRAHVFPLMPSHAAPHAPCGRSTRHVPILRLSEVFAEFPQSPESFLRCLRSSRKGQKIFRGACGVSAKAKKFFETLAEFPQTPKSFSRHLQHRCKRQKVFRGTCNTVANTKKNLGAFATLLQTFSFQRTKLFTKSLAPDPLLTPF